MPAAEWHGPLDVGGRDFLDNPYPQLAWLRETQPLHRSASGAWVLTRAADITQALSDPRLGNVPAPWATVNLRNRGKYFCAEVANNILPFLDGERHRTLRTQLSRAWSEQLRHAMPDIDAIASELLEARASREQFDGLADFATPFSVRVISDILGIPSEHRAACHAELQWFFYLFTGIPDRAILRRVDEGLRTLRGLLGALVDDAATGGLIGHLVAQGSVQTVGRDVLVDNIALLLADGVENVDSGIANAIAALLDHRDQWDAVCAEPDLAKPAAVEALRYESPATFIGRIVQEDFEWLGETLSTGEAVLLMLASGNRDPSRFERPDLFHIRRPDALNLSFGKGHHSCVGASLARQETAAAIRALATRFPGLQSATGVRRWRQRIAHRWLEALPLRLS